MIQFKTIHQLYFSKDRLHFPDMSHLCSRYKRNEHFTWKEYCWGRVSCIIMSSSWHVPVKGLFCKVTVTHWFPICLLSHYLMSSKNYVPGNSEVADCKSAAEIYREILPHHHILCDCRPGNLSQLVVCFSTFARLKYARMNPIDFDNPMAFTMLTFIPPKLNLDPFFPQSLLMIVNDWGKDLGLWS